MGTDGAVRIRPVRGHLLVLAGAALFGLNASVSKVVLGTGLEPARLTALRCTGAALGLLLLASAARKRLRVPLRDLPAMALLGLSGAALIQWLYFVAIDRLPVGIALLLEFTGPVLVAVYARVVLRQDIHRQVWLALGLALGGLALVAQVWTDVGLDPIGVAAGFGAATCLATFYLLGKSTVERHDDPMTLSFWMFTFAALFWAVAQPWWDFEPGLLGERVSLLGAFEGIEAPVWLPLLCVVVLGTLVPYALEVAALRHLTPTTTGVVGMAEPVIAAAVAWLWLDEVLSPVQLLGGLLVLGGVVLAQLARSRPVQRDAELAFTDLTIADDEDKVLAQAAGSTPLL